MIMKLNSHWNRALLEDREEAERNWWCSLEEAVVKKLGWKAGVEFDGSFHALSATLVRELPVFVNLYVLEVRQWIII